MADISQNLPMPASAPTITPNHHKSGADIDKGKYHGRTASKQARCNPRRPDAWHYDRAPNLQLHDHEKNVAAVPMRDSVTISRSNSPTTAASFQHCWRLRSTTRTVRARCGERVAAQPPWSSLWAGPARSRDAKFFVSRGCVHRGRFGRAASASNSTAMGRLRSRGIMDRAASSMVRRQCRDRSAFPGFGRTVVRGQAKSAASESDFPGSIRAALIER